MKKKWLAGLLSVMTVATLLTGCGSADKALVFSSEDTEEVLGIEGPELEEAHDLEPVEQDVMIYVHVCGAVLNPGVVTVHSGCRAEEVLEAAGGFSPDADREYVNLASPVEDGQQLYFPTAEEAERWRDGMSVSRSGQILMESTLGKVNINTADESLLCTLPGIGKSRAQAIIAYREQKGPFESAEDIMKVSGIKESAFDKISSMIAVE